MALDLLKRDFKEELKRIPDLMNVFLYHAPRDIRFEKIPLPKISHEEILVKVKVALTCGTDLKTYQRGHPVLIKSVPSTFGHQFSGTIVNVGREVTNFNVGQNVVALNSAPCYRCIYCQKERFSLCENIEFVNGAYAEYIKIPRRVVKYNTYEIPDYVSFETAATLESLSVVLHGFQRSEITPDKTVCVIGTGSIGLLFTAVCKQKGVKVISIGRKDHKLRLASELGAFSTLNLNSFSSLNDLINKVYESVPFGPDVVVEAVGIPETWELATKLVGRGGVVNFFGGCKKDAKIQLDTYRLHYDELKLLGVFHHTPLHARKALELLSDKLFNKNVLEKIITHTMPLSDLEKAFLIHESGEAIQVAIKP